MPTPLEPAVSFPPADNPRDKPWIVHAPVISTEHFPQGDLDYFFDPEVCLMHSNDGDTVLLCIEDPHECVEDLSPTGLAILEHFDNLGYSYLRLDPNGHFVKELPIPFPEHTNHCLPIITTPL